MHSMLTPYREIEQLPCFTVPQAYVLDYDRTLGDVDAATARLCQAAELFSEFNPTIVAHARERTEADGGSFSPLTFLEQMLNAQQMQEFEQRFVHRASPALLYPEAKPFLQLLTANKIPHCILTYGVQQRWQELKLAASDYHGLSRIIPHTDKGKELAQWQSESGLYSFIGYDQAAEPYAIVQAAELVLVDDKIRSLSDLPKTARGIHINRTNEVVELPARCLSVRSLGEIAIPSPYDELPKNIVGYYPLAYAA